MRITAKKAVTNRVRLRTIITYDFMLYGSRRFRGRISRSASLTASTKTRLEIVAHFRNLERLTRFLLHQMTMLENQRAPGPRRQLAPSEQNCSNLREMEFSVSDDNISSVHLSPFRVV
jgi:hypothetical protein